MISFWGEEIKFARKKSISNECLKRSNRCIPPNDHPCVAKSRQMPCYNK